MASDEFLEQSSGYGQQTEALLLRAISHIERTAAPLRKSNPEGIPAAIHALGRQWIEQFIMKPHEDLGRTGAVCPFVQPAYMAEAVYATSVEVADFSFDRFVQLVLRLPESYKRIMATNDVSPLLFALIVFLPDMEKDKYARFIDLTQMIAKPVFMAAGLMIGEFRPNSQVSGVHSNRFYPMRNTVPAFVVRVIAPHDILFINRPTTPPALRAHEIECFLAATKVSTKKDQRLRKSLHKIKTALGHFGDLPLPDAPARRQPSGRKPMER